MIDERIKILASRLIEHSVRLQKGENLLIEATDVDYQLVSELVRIAEEKGAYPYVSMTNQRVKRQMLLGSSPELFKRMADFDSYRMDKMQAYIGIRGGENNLELSDVPDAIMSDYSVLYSKPVHHNIRVAKTKWVILRYPNGAMAQLCNMSTDQYERFYFDVCNLDYGKMDRAMDALKNLMEKTDKVRIVAPNTDLTFSIKGIPAVKCAGECNIPDGEIYTAPVKNSVNGRITYNTPSIENGFKFENVSLLFKDGKIIEATANNTEAVNKIFDTDEGARFVGEFSFGVNPYITHPVGDILFDEKISGSIHFTPGACYEDSADNGNQSSIHWDLVLVQTKAFGGGEIWMDDVLVRKDGLFVLPELECLNPENLK